MKKDRWKDKRGILQEWVFQSFQYMSTCKFKWSCGSVSLIYFKNFFHYFCRLCRIRGCFHNHRPTNVWECFLRGSSSSSSSWCFPMVTNIWECCWKDQSHLVTLLISLFLSLFLSIPLTNRNHSFLCFSSKKTYIFTFSLIHQWWTTTDSLSNSFSSRRAQQTPYE